MEQNLSQYKIFYEVARTGNISRAAKELYISQPAISKSISKLEASLNVTLFNRNSRGVQLTAEGLILMEHVKSAFEALNRGEQELKRIRDFHIGHIRIGVSNTLCRFVLLPYLKDFIGQFPHINVTIECQSTAHTLAMLEQQHIDIGLVAQPSTTKGLALSPVMEIADTFVATPQYLENLRLREGNEVNLIESANLMLLDRNNMTRLYIDEYLLENHVIPQNVLEATTMDLLVEFSRIGLGIGCVIREFVQDDLESGALIEIPLEPPIKKRTIGFAYNPNSPSNALLCFLQFLNIPES